MHDQYRRIINNKKCVRYGVQSELSNILNVKRKLLLNFQSNVTHTIFAVL
jgi:antitoxin component HigA of HigAB toxin-antitoxin module